MKNVIIPQHKKLTSGSLREKVYVWIGKKTISIVQAKTSFPELENVHHIIYQLHKEQWLDKQGKGNKATFCRSKTIPQKIKSLPKVNTLKTQQKILPTRKNSKAELFAASQNNNTDNDADFERSQHETILNAQPIQLGALIENIQVLNQQNAIYKQGLETIAHILEQLNIIEGS